jgi:hypothetical protein
MNHFVVFLQLFVLLSLGLSASEHECYIEVSKSDIDNYERFIHSHVKSLYFSSSYRGHQGYLIERNLNHGSWLQEGDAIVRVDDCYYPTYNFLEDTKITETRYYIDKFVYLILSSRFISSIHINSFYVIRNKQKIKYSGFGFLKQTIISNRFDKDIIRINEHIDYPAIVGNWFFGSSKNLLQVENKNTYYSVTLYYKEKMIAYSDLAVTCDKSLICMFTDNNSAEPILKVRFGKQVKIIQSFDKRFNILTNKSRN